MMILMQIQLVIQLLNNKQIQLRFNLVRQTDFWHLLIPPHHIMLFILIIKIIPLRIKWNVNEDHFGMDLVLMVLQIHVLIVKYHR